MAMRIFHALGTLAACTLMAATAWAQRGETVKIAWIDPLSGMMAAVGDNQLKGTQLIAEMFNNNNASGVTFEILPFDNKLSPSETTAAFRSALDQGVRYVLQGNGSSNAMALLDAVEKHNARNRGNEVLYFNTGAVDPDLTNSKCSYWHIQLDASTTMKVQALTNHLKDVPEVKKVYLINQNYSQGQQYSRIAKEMLKTKRPDVEIVGDDFVPLGQVRDFSPYVAKIKASGADSILTSNWGTDLSLLIKSVSDAGMQHVRFYADYAQAKGAPTALAAAGDVQVYGVGYAHYNMGSPAADIRTEYKRRTDEDFAQMAIYHAFALLDAAFAQTASTDPVKVAAALDGMRIQSLNGEVEVRQNDHQLQQQLFVVQWQKTNAQYPYDVENTGYVFVPISTIDAAQASTPTTCQMKRP